MEKAMLIPARSLTRGWKLHAKHQLWHPHCLTLAVAGATEVKNAAQSQQGESSARAELFPSFPSPKAGVSAAEILPVQRSWGFFKYHLFFTVCGGSRWTPGCLEITTEQGGLGSPCHQGRSCVPPSQQPGTAVLCGTDAKSSFTPNFPSKTTKMWCLGNGLVVDLGLDGLKELFFPHRAQNSRFPPRSEDVHYTGTRGSKISNLSSNP